MPNRQLCLTLLLVMATSACTRMTNEATPVTSPPPATTTVSNEEAPSTTQFREELDEHGLDRRVAPPYDPVAWFTSHGVVADADLTILPREEAEVGDIEVFRVSDEVGTVEVSAELVYATDLAAMWVETGANPDPAEYQFAALVLTDDIIPALTEVFGPLPDPGVDGTRRIDILHVASLGSAAGEFAYSDRLPTAIAPESNEREMLYVNLQSTAIGSDSYMATLAHELQHLIDHEVRPNTPLWLSEGLAQLAERIAGYDAVGTDTEFLASDAVQLNTWGALQLDTRHYGAAYLFTLYLWERFGDSIAADVAASPYDGLAAVDAALAGRETTVEQVFADWVVANYLDDPELDPRFGYAGDTLRPLCPVDRALALPHQVSREINQFAARYHSVEGDGPVTIEFSGSETTSPIPDLPHRGTWMWWSGRSDSSNATLTRTFDLSNVSSATLEFRMWLDAGIGDAAVVSASTDGGTTWTALEGSRSFPSDEFLEAPYYSGTTGRGGQAVWVGDEMDLSPYAGGEVTVRFHYITDLFENRFGFALDEIEIPEIGYSEGAESPSDWVADGFVRVPGQLDQPWIVRLVDPADATVVTDLDIEQGSARVELILEPGRPVTIVVAPVALATAVPASYDLDISGAAAISTTASGPDDFTDPCAGWELEREATYNLRLQDQQLAIDLLEEQVFTWSARDGFFEDVTIEATGEFGDGTGIDGAIGAMCRISNDGFYDFEISSDGYVFAGMALGDGFEILHDWEPSDLVETGDGARNTYSLDCTGDELTFSVNGSIAIQLTDDRLGGGQVALSGSSFDGSGFSLFYTDVDVSGGDVTAGDSVVRTDEFDDADTEWTMASDSRSVLEVADGRYVATVRPRDWGVEGFAGLDVSDVIFDVDVEVLDDAVDGSITLSCRNQASGDQYLFMFGLDGFVSSAAYIDEEWDILTDWEITSQISAVPGEVNHVQVRCIGETIEMAINGVTVTSATDDRLTGGDIGLGLFTFEHGEYVVAFDNVVVRRAE